MINLTRDIVVLDNSDLRIDYLKSVKNVRELLFKFYKITPCSDINEKGYSFLLRTNHDFKDIEINHDFLNNLLEFTLDKQAKNCFIGCHDLEIIPIIEKPFLMAHFKLVLLDLWLNKKILIPIRFNLQGNIIQDEMIVPYKNKVINDIEKLFLKRIDKVSKDLRVQYIKRVCRLIWSTDYFDAENVSMEEINKLHIRVIESKNGLDNIVSHGVNFNFDTFLNDLNDLYDLRGFDFKNYKSWLSGYNSRYKKMDYFEYLDNLDYIKERRRKYNIEQTIERSKKSRKSKDRKYVKSKKVNKNSDIDDHMITPEKSFLEIVKGQKSWNKEIPYYDNYNIKNLDLDSKAWLSLRDAFFNNRKRNGYESTKSYVVALNFLFNYIFFYLNIWNEENKNPISIPKAPKDLHRTIFINNTLVSSKLDERPFTLFELLDYMYNSPSQKNTIIRGLNLFFDFVKDFYMDDENICGDGFENPIRKNDYFRESKNKKTNKVIIPKRTYINLKKYLYAIESFGEYLFEKCIENEDFINFDMAKENIIKTENLGYIPIFFDKDKCFPIMEVSNTFNYKKRFIRVSENKNKEMYIPSNTVVRGFILMLNTGLRSAQVKWLDKDEWDINQNNEQQFYYKIKINTDKTSNDWMTYIPYGVYNSLKKEGEFQDLMQEDFVNKRANYQGRDFTRFEDINCLFKSNSKKGYPVDINQYWADLLWAFQNTLNNVDENKCELVYYKKDKEIIRTSVDGCDYCDLKVYAVHTPHSMRATFCTHMSEYLERSEIAYLVGHSSDLITSEVYIKPEDETIKEKMERAVNVFESGVNSDYFKVGSPAHVKPNMEESSLQKAFLQDREQTIALFNISSISMNINKDSEEQSKKAINLLKDARMDKIIFETTHICPVGGICPQEVMGIIGEKRRCGLCPLALKSIDNLNPIYAKQRDLIREIKEGKESLDRAIKNKESEITITSIEDKVNLDIRELVSWKFSADILSVHYEDLKNNKDMGKKYYVEMPDMVKSHLEKVSISNEKEYLLARLADSNAYSVYNNPENKYQAEMIKRRVIKNLNLFDYDDYYVSEDQKIETFCAMIYNMMESNGVDLKRLVQYDCFESIENQQQKINKLSFSNKISLENKKGDNNE